FIPITGQARMEVRSFNSAAPFRAVISTSTLGSGNGFPLGVDVEFMITNVNAAVPNECVRNQQNFRANSGSNVDAGNGEDSTQLTCFYDLPARVEVFKFCPPAPVAPGGLLLFSGFVSNSGLVSLTNVTVFNDQPVPG